MNSIGSLSVAVRTLFFFTCLPVAGGVDFKILVLITQQNSLIKEYISQSVNFINDQNSTPTTSRMIVTYQPIASTISYSQICDKLKSGYSMMVDLTETGVSSAVKNFAETLGILTIGIVKKQGLLTFKFHWFILSKDFSSASTICVQCPDKYSVVTMTPKSDSHIAPLVTYVNSTVGNLTQSQQNNRAGSFGEFVFSPKENFETINLSIDRLIIDKTRQIHQLGRWNYTRGLELRTPGPSLIHTNITKRYRVATIHEPPFMYIKSQADGRKEYRGYCKDLIEKLSQMMDFEYDLYEVSDGAYGRQLDNGSWTGLIKELLDDKADIVAAPLSLTAERESVIDFTIPYYDLVGITILMQKPTFEYRLFKFMTVLENDVWLCVLSAFFFVSLLLFVFDKYSPYSYQNNRDKWDGDGDEPRVFSLKEGLWFCMTSLTPQGGGEVPRAISGRLIAATWWLFGFIMIATYTANLAAFLTVQRLETPIESLDDLAKQFQTKYAPQESTSAQVYFKRMADIEAKFYGIWKEMSLNDSMSDQERAKLAVWDYPVSDKFTNMWTAMELSKFPKNQEEAIRRVKNGSFAFIGDETSNKYATMIDCGLWAVGESFSRKPYAIAVQEGNIALRNDLSQQILQLLNQRVLEDLKTAAWSKEYIDKHFQKVPECPTVEDESDGISIQNIGGVFLVIFMGIGLALIALAFEFYWYKYKKVIKQKSNSSCSASNLQLDQNDANNSLNYSSELYQRQPTPALRMSVTTIGNNSTSRQRSRETACNMPVVGSMEEFQRAMFY
ncbi:ionotropic receptor 25a-like [Tubulanus polymorphus]|uniref:ionotropic receptor 25a-like n=1 Tax=Tubulanus polymorphus TaxID=672921 RepID=UPI003DA317F0